MVHLIEPKVLAHRGSDRSGCFVKATYGYIYSDSTSIDDHSLSQENYKSSPLFHTLLGMERPGLFKAFTEYQAHDHNASISISAYFSVNVS